MAGTKDKILINIRCTKEDSAKIKLLADGACIESNDCLRRIILGNKVSTPGFARVLGKFMAVLYVMASHARHFDRMCETEKDRNDSPAKRCSAAARKASVTLREKAVPVNDWLGNRLMYDERRNK